MISTVRRCHTTTSKDRKYHKLHEVFGENGWGIKVSTESELDSALQQAEQNRDSLAFIEVVMDKMDNPEILLKLLQQ